MISTSLSLFPFARRFFCAFHSWRINFLCFFLTLISSDPSSPLPPPPRGRSDTSGSFYFSDESRLHPETTPGTPHVHKQRVTLSTWNHFARCIFPLSFPPLFSSFLCFSSLRADFVIVRESRYRPLLRESFRYSTAKRAVFFRRYLTALSRFPHAIAANGISGILPKNAFEANV